MARAGMVFTKVLRSMKNPLSYLNAYQYAVSVDRRRTGVKELYTGSRQTLGSPSRIREPAWNAGDRVWNDLSRSWELRFAVWHCLPAAGTRFARGKQALAGSGQAVPHGLSSQNRERSFSIGVTVPIVKGRQPKRERRTPSPKGCFESKSTWQDPRANRGNHPGAASFLPRALFSRLPPQYIERHGQCAGHQGARSSGCRRTLTQTYCNRHAIMTHEDHEHDTASLALACRYDPLCAANALVGDMFTPPAPEPSRAAFLYQPETGALADVIPFYWKGEYHVLYLQLKPGQKGFDWCRSSPATSSPTGTPGSALPTLTPLMRSI